MVPGKVFSVLMYTTEYSGGKMNPDRASITPNTA